MTPQEVFDKVARHLLTQKRKAMAVMPEAANGDAKPACAYRGSDGTSCAFGCLIPDSCYDPVLENVVAPLIVSRVLPQNYLDKNDIDIIDSYWCAVDCIREELGGADACRSLADLVYDLQHVHDDYEPDDWKDCLVDVATNQSLDSTVLNEFAQ